MEQDIEVFKHKISETLKWVLVVNSYIEKKYSVHKGIDQRVTRIIQLGYTHIEAIVYE